MLKSISNLGTVLSKSEQQTINGGGPGAPGWCNNHDNYGSTGRRKACHQGQIGVYSQALGYCVCVSKAPVNM